MIEIMINCNFFEDDKGLYELFIINLYKKFLDIKDVHDIYFYHNEIKNLKLAEIIRTDSAKNIIDVFGEILPNKEEIEDNKYFIRLENLSKATDILKSLDCLINKFIKFINLKYNKNEYEINVNICNLKESYNKEILWKEFEYLKNLKNLKLIIE